MHLRVFAHIVVAFAICRALENSFPHVTLFLLLGTLSKTPISGWALTRKLSLKDYIETLRSSAMVCGVIMPILAIAYFMGQTMTYFETQKLILTTLLSITDNPIFIIMIIFCIVLIFGMFIDLVPNILILGPLLLPVAVEIGMDPNHFCIWFMFTLAFGFITPPYGFNLFVVSSITGSSIIDISRKMAPFLIAFFITNIIIVLVPGLSLWILGM